MTKVTVARCAAVLAMGMLIQGCATTIAPPETANQPAKVRFGEFKSFQLVPVKVAPAYEANKANLKAAKKIDSLLATNLAMAFPGIQVGDTVPAGEKMLVITPYIEEVKFIGGAARFWLGAMAGSSAMKMRLSFVDQATGDVVADPVFYRKGNAMAGAYSMGASDNAMLDDVVRDVVVYTTSNR